MDFAEHENGQLRLEAAGEQRSLLPLPDSAIPTAPADPLSPLELERFARDHLVISIRTFDRQGMELEARRRHRRSPWLCLDCYDQKEA